MPDPAVRAYVCVEGLSVADALGELAQRRADVAVADDAALPDGPWPWTDDTAQALAVVSVLRRRGAIDGDALADALLRAWRRSAERGWGMGAHRVFEAMDSGVPWREAAEAVFPGGSWGNGAAMRAPPIGAWCSGVPARAAEWAARSAAPTHAHPEGVAGAIAAAVAASLAAEAASGAALLAGVLAHVPDSAVRAGIADAAARLDQPADEVAARLGRGEHASAADTVPFVMWCAARHLDDYRAAVTAAVSAGGDRDTLGAMVGGIVAARVGTAGIPRAWRRAREPLPPFA